MFWKPCRSISAGFWWSQLIRIMAVFYPLYKIILLNNEIQGKKIFQYCTCPAGRVTYSFRSFCKHMHLSFKSVCNTEHKGVICNMTSLSNSSQSTSPTGRVRWEELLILSRFPSWGRVEFSSPEITTLDWLEIRSSVLSVCVQLGQNQFEK